MLAKYLKKFGINLETPKKISTIEPPNKDLDPIARFHQEHIQELKLFLFSGNQYLGEFLRDQDPEDSKFRRIVKLKNGLNALCTYQGWKTETIKFTYKGSSLFDVELRYNDFAPKDKDKFGSYMMEVHDRFGNFIPFADENWLKTEGADLIIKSYIDCMTQFFKRVIVAEVKSQKEQKEAKLFIEKVKIEQKERHLELLKQFDSQMKSKL